MMYNIFVCWIAGDGLHIAMGIRGLIAVVPTKS